MLNPIPSALQQNMPNHHELSQNKKLKKKCVLKKKICHALSESSELCSFSQNTHLYNIFYFNINDPLKQNCPFPLEIFDFQTVTKVYKNSDRITLDLKLCPKLTTNPVQQHNIALSSLYKQNFLKGFFDHQDRNVDLVQLFKKINQVSQKRKTIKENEQAKQLRHGLFLSQEEVSRRTENLLQNRKFSKYIIMENIFQQNVKKIKKIHISNSLLSILGQQRETLALQILEKRALPFKIFKNLDYKRFVSNLISRIGRILKRCLEEDDEKNKIQEEEFRMEASIETGDKNEKTVTVRWACEHPSIVLIEILEDSSQTQCQETSEVQDLATRFEKI